MKRREEGKLGQAGEQGGVDWTAAMLLTPPQSLTGNYTSANYDLYWQSGADRGWR